MVSRRVKLLIKYKKKADQSGENAHGKGKRRGEKRDASLHNSAQAESRRRAGWKKERVADWKGLGETHKGGQDGAAILNHSIYLTGPSGRAGLERRSASRALAEGEVGKKTWRRALERIGFRPGVTALRS